jgi:integrase
VAIVIRKRNKDGSTSYVAQVRLSGFKPAARSFPKRAEAEGWADQLERSLRAQRTRGAVRHDLATLTVGRLLLDFLADSETTALRTFDGMHRLCAWWIQEFGRVRCIEFNVLLVREARDMLQAEGRGPATVNRYLSAMRSAWNWARSAGLVLGSATWPEKVMFSEPRGRTRFLIDDELAALLKSAADYSPLMHAAVVTSIATGLRQGELLRLDWSDLDLQKQHLRVRLSKNDEPRTVHLPESAVQALRALQQSKVRAIGPVFLMPDGSRIKKSTLEARWKTVRNAAKLKDFRWHDLRHTCASILAQQGATLVQIGEQLGHKSLAMTMRYSHLVQGAATPAHAGLDAKLKGHRP